MMIKLISLIMEASAVADFQCSKLIRQNFETHGYVAI